MSLFSAAPITSERKVVRRNVVIRGREPHGYCEGQWTEQALIETWRLFGVPVFQRTIDRERVPDHASIEVGALGATSWRSKFADHIPAQA